jgi:hypothetical protein
MNKLLFSVLIFLSIYSACKEQKDTKTNQLKTYSNFAEKLKPDMNYNQIVATFGEPFSDIGSGIHIYVYKLADSTEMLIGYTDKILYAKQIDKKQQIINELIKF